MNLHQSYREHFKLRFIQRTGLNCTNEDYTFIKNNIFNPIFSVPIPQSYYYRVGVDGKLRKRYNFKE